LAACASVFSSGVAEINPVELSVPPVVQPTSTVIPAPVPNPFSLESLANWSYGDGEFNIEYI
jgi:hypothetical protein